MRARRILFLLLLAAGLIPVAGCGKLVAVWNRPSANMPSYKPVSVLFQNQNWSTSQRALFYHTSQGTELVPYRWYCALEQPRIKIFGSVPKFSQADYLARFGFLPDATGEAGNCELPVGFARDHVVDPHTGQTVEVVGLTCAACHTGQLEYRGKGVRIDGGSAGVDLESFQTELGYALAFTDKVPFRFERFARRVLGDDASSEAKEQLKQQFKQFMKAGSQENDAAVSGALYAAAGGFGRTDALGRIGNYVFGTELNNKNLIVADAPVKLPPLWYTSWFAWVQYNASIQQPMVRNIGEALGVRARVNLNDPDKLYRSTVNVKNLRQVETLLAGPTAFAGLRSPSWPADVFGPIDQGKAADGAQLYKQHCQPCHLPPLNSPALQDPKYWESGLEGKQFLKLHVIPLEEIGTDPQEATNWAARTADTGALGLGKVPASEALWVVTTKIRDQAYDTLGLTNEQRIDWNGFRADGVAAPLSYRARPLAGIWSTPPFLHNGSVPNLYELLIPASRRDKTFYRGSREFDPVHVGYEEKQLEGGFKFRADQLSEHHPGNSNAGHSFENRPGAGVIGPELTDVERWAIIEYLKTL